MKKLVYDITRSGYSGYCTIELVTMYMNQPRLYFAIAIERVREMLRGVE